MNKIETIDTLFNCHEFFRSSDRFFDHQWFDAFFSLAADPQISSQAYKTYFEKKLLDCEKNAYTVARLRNEWSVVYLLILTIAAEILGDDIAYSYFLKFSDNEKTCGIERALSCITDGMYGPPQSSITTKTIVAKVFKKIGFFLKYYKKFPINRRLKIKLGGYEFFLSLLRSDEEFIRYYLIPRENYVPLSHQFVDLTSKDLIDHVVNIDKYSNPIEAFKNVEESRKVYHTALASVWSYLDYKGYSRQIGINSVIYSPAWKKCFSSGDRTKWAKCSNIDWYDVARNIRIFRGDMKAGLVPNFPEVKQFLNGKTPSSLDLKKKDKYMRAMGFRSLEVSPTKHVVAGKFRREANYSFTFLLKYLEAYGPLHLQCGPNKYSTILDADSVNKLIKIDDWNRISFKDFLKDWLYYPEFLTPELSRQIADYNKRAYWHSMQRYLLEPITDPLARRKRLLPPAPNHYKSKTPEPYFYSPIYYFKGSAP